MFQLMVNYQLKDLVNLIILLIIVLIIILMLFYFDLFILLIFFLIILIQIFHWQQQHLTIDLSNPTLLHKN